MSRSAWAKANPERAKVLGKAHEARHKVKLDAWLDAYKAAHPCACGEADVATLEFHHTDPAVKGFSIGKRNGLRLSRVMAEVAKCEIMCANCHRKGHAGRPSCARHAAIEFGPWNIWARLPAVAPKPVEIDF